MAINALLSSVFEKMKERMEQKIGETWFATWSREKALQKNVAIEEG